MNWWKRISHIKQFQLYIFNIPNYILNFIVHIIKIFVTILWYIYVKYCCIVTLWKWVSKDEFCVYLCTSSSVKSPITSQKIVYWKLLLYLNAFLSFLVYNCIWKKDFVHALFLCTEIPNQRPDSGSQLTCWRSRSSRHWVQTNSPLPLCLMSSASCILYNKSTFECQSPEMLTYCLFCTVIEFIQMNPITPKNRMKKRKELY